MVVRDAQGGVSVYNVETSKHRVLLTSSSFVSIHHSQFIATSGGYKLFVNCCHIHRSVFVEIAFSARRGFISRSGENKMKTLRCGVVDRIDDTADAVSSNGCETIENQMTYYYQYKTLMRIK